MKHLIFALAMSGMICACSNKAKEAEDNPFFTEFKTPYGTPDFSKIKFEHYEPAFMEGIKQQNEEIQTIIDNKEAPTFENTIVALDNSGSILARVSGVFFALTSADTNDDLTKLEEKMGPILAEHSDNIYLNEALFKRVNAVHEDEVNGKIKLTTEQHYLLDKYYKGFVRSGAALPADKQKRLREINKELSALTIKFSNNLLDDTNAFQLVIDNKEDLAGLPADVVTAAADEAKAAGKEGKWLFTLQNSSRIPFLQYAQNRELRKKIYQAYINKGNNGNKSDNKDILKNILTLRLEKAKIMGYSNYAQFKLDDTMAKKPENVMKLLNNLWGYSIKMAKNEVNELQAIMDKDPNAKGEKLEAWDWWYYAEKLRKEKYDLDEAQLKPYFSLENVRQGLYTVVNKLYGITVEPTDSVSVYNKDVQAYIVKDKDGSHIGVFYADYTPRAGKRSGAWMSNFREQKEGVRPLVYNVGSFTKPTGDTPALLSLDEVETMFHEFGHGLHGLLTKCKYQGVSGTSVARDFVELPSQVLEHWAFEPEVLKMYAKDYKTGKTIPDALVKKIQDQAHFNQGFATTEYLAAAILDMELHSLTSTNELDVNAYEKRIMDNLGLIKQIAPRYRATYFNHIAGGYDAGYYSYIWAEQLDADAFDLFKQKGIFDQETAKKFRENVLEKGGSDDPMKLYKQFRGQEPTIDALLRNRGMK